MYDILEETLKDDKARGPWPMAPAIPNSVDTLERCQE